MPIVYVNVQRGGPGIGTIQPAQQDYTQATKASGNGGFRMRVFSPSTVQEAVDMTYAAFDYAQQDRNPVLILTDGVMGTIMEPVELPPERSAEEVKALKDQCRSWAAVGHDSYKEPRATVDAGRWDTKEQERHCKKAEELYKSWPSEAETLYLDDAEVVVTGYGICGRIARSAVKLLRAEGHKVGFIRPKTLYPFPADVYAGLDFDRVKAILDVEMCIPAQVVDDIRLAINGPLPHRDVPARRRRDHGTRRGHGRGQETAGTIRRRRTWKKVYTRTKGIQPDMVDGFCPGCMHSTLFKLIGEVLEEMDMLDKCTCAIGVGCCGLGMGYFTYDYLLAAHGRACAVATGMKRSNPDTLVFTYQGDGDLASIGLAETMSAANRGENISVIFVNNGIYGMTGGQLAPTTLVGMKATTAPKGRDPREHGYPMHVCEILNQLTAPYYLERTSCNNPPIMWPGRRRPSERHSRTSWTARGFSLVEIVTSCPTNWGLEPLEALGFLEEKMFKEFPLGVIRDKDKEGA